MHPYWTGVELTELLSDASFFMRDYQTPISLSALQAYYSGAVSMPKCALRKMTMDIDTARLISERDRGWETGTIILEGHTGTVYSVAFSSDGSRIVSGSYDHTVRIWDTVSGAVQRTLEGHTSAVYSVAFSSNGSRIVSGSDDYTVRIWDAVVLARPSLILGRIAAQPGLTSNQPSPTLGGIMSQWNSMIGDPPRRKAVRVLGPGACGYINTLLSE
jgi:WD40 repeat protein